MTHDTRMKKLDQEILAMEEKLHVLKDLQRKAMDMESQTFQKSHDLNQQLREHQSEMQFLEIESVSTQQQKDDALMHTEELVKQIQMLNEEVIVQNNHSANLISMNKRLSVELEQFMQANDQAIARQEA